MSKKILTLCLMSVMTIAAISVSQAPRNAAPISDPSDVVGGLFGNFWADFACGVGVGAVIGITFITGGAAAIAAAVVAPKAAAACILAAAM